MGKTSSGNFVALLHGYLAVTVDGNFSVQIVKVTDSTATVYGGSLVRLHKLT